MAAANYTDFLQSKQLIVPNAGVTVAEEAINPHLFPFQKALVKWSLRKGRAAIFSTTGTGKTRMQLAWAEKAADRVLILAPLAVAKQTVREGEKMGILATYARSQEQAAARGITITNYEMLHCFDPEAFGAVVLDESGILKSYDGKTRTLLIETFRQTPMRLCCTATPAPNDISEIANHAEFLGVMSRQEMIAAFFINRSAGKDLQLKRHGREHFYRWLASWGMSLNKPGDLGYSDEGYNLPGLEIIPHFVETDFVPEGRLFAMDLKGVTERASVRRGTLQTRIDAAVEIMRQEPAEPWLCWYGLIDEGRWLSRCWGEDGVFVEGSLAPEEKEARLLAFVDGRARALISHPLIAGFGLNLQHCARMIFVGLGDSYEQYFQCIRRCWRFGQTRPVKVHIVLSEMERIIFENVLRKEREALAMSAELVRHVAQFERAELAPVREKSVYRAEREMILPRWLS